MSGFTPRLFLLVFSLFFVLLFGCVDNDTILPFTTSQLINSSTDLNYSSFRSSDYNGMVLVIDGNKISVADASDLNVALPDLSIYVPYTGATTTVNLGGEMLTTTGQVQATSFFGDSVLLWDLAGASNGAVTMLSKDAGNSVTIGATNSVSDIHGSKLFQFMSGQNKFEFVQSPTYATYFMVDVSDTTPVLSSYLNDTNMDGNWNVNGNLFQNGFVVCDASNNCFYDNNFEAWYEFMFPRGSGTEADPFMIYDCNALQDMQDDLTASYALGQDIDCSDTINWNDGNGFVPVGNSSTKFSGSFDGRNHTISNLYIYLPETDYVGLFGYVTDNTKDINNLGMIDSNITGYLYVGGISAYYGGINNSYNTGTINGYDYTGGLTGQEGTINNSYNTGTINGANYTGGITGYLGSVTNSYNTGTITGTGIYTGGINGRETTVSNCYNTGTITGENSYVGGITGYRGNITNSHNDGNVNGDDYTGGIMGEGTGKTVTDSYNTGAIDGSGSYTGGIIGRNGTVTDSYNTGTITNTGSYTGGIIGRNATVINSYNTGTINGAGQVGGILGREGSATNCYNTGTINASGIYSGGIIGYIGIINNCYNTGTVNGSNKTGGISGIYGRVNNSYNTGTVIGSDSVGGITGNGGNTYGGNITNSYNTGYIQGTYDVGGISGYIDTGYEVTNSFSTSTVKGTAPATNFGGVGNVQGTGTITNIYWADTNASDDADACYYGGDANCTILTGIDYTQLFNPDLNVYDTDAPVWDGNWVWRDNDYPILAWQTEESDYTEETTSQWASNSTGDIYANNYNNVGVGTSTPQNKLNVVGDFNVVGNSYFQNIYNRSDTYKTFFGLGDDASIYYNGTDLVINPREVGTGDVVIPAGKLEINAGGLASGTAMLRFASDRAWNFLTSGTGSGTGLVLKPEAVAKHFYIRASDDSDVAHFFANSSGLNEVYLYDEVGIGTASPTAVLDVDGNTRIRDNLIVDGDANVVGDLFVSENVVIDGNLDYDNYYAEGWYGGAGTYYTIDLETTNVPVDLNEWTPAVYNGFVFDGNGVIVPRDGIYSLNGTVTFIGGNGSDYGFNLTVDGVAQQNCSNGSTAISNTKINVSISCLLDLNIGNYLSVQVRDRENPVQDIDIYKSNFNIHRIGN